MVIERPVRVALVSDTHGYICPQVLSVVRDCDMVVHAGDICGKHILDALNECNDHVLAVAGNNDLPEHWAEAEQDTVEALPRTAELELPGGRLEVEHGHEHGWAEPDLDSLRAAHPGARAVVYGHTHKRLVDRSGAPWILNPGAAGSVRNYGGPSCLVIHASSEHWEIEAFRFREPHRP
jgi:putative phosphoesterase